MIVDAHLDIAWNELAEGRGFEQPPAPGYLVSRSALVEAGIGLVFATLYCAPAGSRVVRSDLSYRTPQEALLIARAQLGYYRAAGLPRIADRTSLERHLRGWRPGRLAAVILMEGADPIQAPADVAGWAAEGVRIIGPAWSRTRYSGGTGAPGGLTEIGFQLLTEMAGSSLILDLSHLAEQALQDCFDAWQGPLIASHSNAQALNPGDRQLSDRSLAEIGRRGGVIGVSFFRGHLRADGRAARMPDVVRHVRHLARAAGGPEHVGLGTDSDGGFAARDSPLRNLKRLPALAPLLRAHFSRVQVEGILGGNWIDFLRRSLPR